MEAVIGIGLGVVLIIGIQFVCYALFDEEHARKAIVIALSSVFIGILAAIIIMKVAG